MAPVRVRGCAARASIDRGSDWQADASRWRNGPRKARPSIARTTFARCSVELITERLSSKSCPADAHQAPRHREKVGVAEAAKPQQASVGTKTRSDGRDAHGRLFT